MSVAEDMWDKFTDDFNQFVLPEKENGENYYKILNQLERNLADRIAGNPVTKEEIYDKTLEWVNEIRTTKMRNQKPLDSLMPGNEMEAEACTIAMSLDTKYETTVGGSLLESVVDDPEFEPPESKELTWYAEWVNLDDRSDFGYAQLPWYAYMLARGFDFGAFPELTSSYVASN